VWADTLLAFERAHLDRLLVWGGASVAVGVLLLTALAARRVDSPLLRHFGIQTAAWGAIDVALALWAARGLTLRDHAAATALDRFLWLNLGLDVGYVGVGATLAVAGWALGRRLGAVGAGLAVITQGAALFLLDLIVVQQLRGTV
jgi:hypothetical protein